VRAPCSVPRCNKPQDARGYCPTHYFRWRTYGDPLREKPPSPVFHCSKPGCQNIRRSPGLCAAHYRPSGACSIPDCDNRLRTSQYCGTHAKRVQKYGDPMADVPIRGQASLEYRVLSKIDKNGPIPDYNPSLGPCWIWTGFTHPGRGHYGRFSYRLPNGQKKQAVAHRLVYRLLRGEVPAELELDHLCRVHQCVNPDHLEPVTPKINQYRGMGFASVNAAKTHCATRHPYNHANTYIDKHGYRHCRPCRAAAEARRRMRDAA
jgi:hypothetical protein